MPGSVEKGMAVVWWPMVVLVASVVTGRECVASVNVTILIAGMPIAAALLLVTSMAKFR